jgi:acyl-CoA thioester hydrolase
MPSAPPEKFTTSIEVGWSDQDRNGHVNNALAVTLLEEARVRASRAWMGTTPEAGGPRVVRTVDVAFDHELRYAPVLAKVWISHIGRASYMVAHELYQDGVLCVRGDSVIVNLDAETRRPTPLSADIRETLESVLIL